MKSDFLAAHMLNAASSVSESAALLINRSASFQQAVAFCGAYRRIAISSLLLQGLPDEFFENLFRSGRAFGFFLENAQNKEEQTLSKMIPFFDAVAGCDEEGARKIAVHSLKRHDARMEYEDDFLHFSFLMGKFYLDVLPSELDGMLLRWENILAGQPDFRFDLCKSLQTKDSALFETGFVALAEQVVAKARKAARFESEPEEDLATFPNVSVEGLALIRFAERLGMAVPEVLPLVPAVTRPPVQPRYDPESWRRPVKVLGKEIDDNVFM